MDQMQETSQRILESAKRRFLHYGYQKTAMGEIAKDLKMSTGNLYRFFPCKLDIAEAIASEHEEEERQIFINISNMKITAEQRFRDFFNHQLVDTNEQISQNAKVYDLVQTIMHERPDFGEKRLERERAILVKIFKDGVNLGEFANNNSPEELMKSMQWATARFRFSYFHISTPLDVLQKELDGVINLLLAGLKCR